MPRSATVLFFSLVFGASASAQEAHLPYVGRLLDTAGAPVDGEMNPRISLYTDAAGTTHVWRKTFAGVVFQDGYFSVALAGDDDTGRNLSVALANDALWVGVATGTTDLTPRTRLASSGYLRLRDVDEACATGLSGVIRYRGDDLQLCDGTEWLTVFTSAFSATGGTITTAGGYTIHTFAASGTFTPERSGVVEALLVGGGGAGGSSLTGGGGGGAVAYNPSLTVTAQPYTITVGAGGVGVANTGVAGGSGGSTIAFGQTATGGAGAVGRYAGAGGVPVGFANGGGAASDAITNRGIGVSPTAQPGWTVYAGNDGGSGGGTTPNYPGGGGAGAGADGQTPSSSSAAGGNGGNGVLINITGTALYWGGGGGGSSYTGANGGGNGGLGGGGGGSANSGAGGSGGASALNAGSPGVSGNGNSSASQAGGDGGANTGGGGGAGNHEPGRGGHGGTGVVIIRYPTP